VHRRRNCGGAARHAEDIGGVPEEKEFKEDELKLPAFPDDAALIEFRPRGHSKNRFYVDRNSVSLGADWVVRYTAVIKSPSGVANVSYEGLRCKTSSTRCMRTAPQPNMVECPRPQVAARWQHCSQFPLLVMD
jgi:hypothetical protein